MDSMSKTNDQCKTPWCRGDVIMVYSDGTGHCDKCRTKYLDQLERAAASRLASVRDRALAEAMWADPGAGVDKP